VRGIIINRYGQALGVIPTKAKVFKNGKKGFEGLSGMNDPETGKRFSVYLQLVEQKPPTVTVAQDSKES
jgi:hypothetical protein